MDFYRKRLLAIDLAKTALSILRCTFDICAEVIIKNLSIDITIDKDCNFLLLIDEDAVISGARIKNGEVVHLLNEKIDTNTTSTPFNINAYVICALLKIEKLNLIKRKTVILNEAYVDSNVNISKIKDVKLSADGETFTLTTESGYTCTAHNFNAKHSNFKVGDKVYVTILNGQPVSINLAEQKVLH